jgi:hypothetical protein
MDWLKSHEFLAVWLSLPMMLIIAVIQGFKTDTEKEPLGVLAIYFAFLTCLGVSVTKAFDDNARFFAGFMSFAVLLYIAARNSNIDWTE